MASLSDAVISVITAGVTIAVVATIVSKNAQTPQVLTAGGQAYSSIISAALAPVTGNNFNFSGNGLTLQ